MFLLLSLVNKAAVLSPQPLAGPLELLGPEGPFGGQPQALSATRTLEKILSPSGGLGWATCDPPPQLLYPFHQPPIPPSPKFCLGSCAAGQACGCQSTKPRDLHSSTTLGLMSPVSLEWGSPLCLHESLQGSLASH